MPNGNYTVLVKFWNDPTATASGNLIYSDTQTVAVTNGMLNIAIPNLTSEGDSLDPSKFAQPLWVEITINGEKLSPRQKLLGTPYAFSLVGGAAVLVGTDAQAAPLIANAAAGQGAFNVGNRTASNAAGSPGTRGLTVTILDDTDSDIIRGCAGGLDCSNTYLEFRVNGNGNVTADGNFTGGGADYAEMIKAEGSAAGLEPGDVLVVSATQDRAVAKSSSANDPSLAGVYSTEPGFIGGGSFEEQPGYVPVAIMGIVPVKVTAANGPIHRGDLLTSSDIPGYAMLATVPGFGTILGKAMGELLEGEGVIEILLLLR
ncbi:MAG: hypothetical protein Q8L87_16415 [Anaerolineales bacterium]|nr:hypothetical protein [Anaerolineales bacterium]